MYNLLEKLITIISFYDIQNTKKFHSIINAMSLIRLFPKVQNHFEIFLHIRRFDITIVTSTNTQDETFILQSGFLQKKV